MKSLKNVALSLLAFALMLGPLVVAGTWAWHWTGVGSQNDASHPLLTLELNVNDRNQSITPFNGGLVSVTFDDGWQSIYSQGFPLLERYGINTTQYISTGVIASPDYMSWDQLVHLQQGGHEIAAHTHTHADLTKLSAEELTFELTEPKRILAALGPVSHMASPYNAHNQAVRAAIAKVYASHRTTDWPYINTKSNLDPYRILAFTVLSTTSVDEIEDLLAQAKAQNGWLVLVYHELSNGGEFSTTTTSFEDHLKAIQNSNLPTATVGEVLFALED